MKGVQFKGRDILSIRDFSKEELLYVLSVAKKMEARKQPNLLKGHILGTLFFEASTRTRLSFTSAMERLGGEVLGFDSTASSSIKKGESLWDTIKMAAQYVDVVVIRHPVEGAARLAAEASSVPVINAGDGSNQHPTQTMLDLYTILKEKGKLENLNIGFVGDLKYGRAVHSLVTAMSHFNAKMFFIAPEALQIPDEYTEELREKKIKYVKETDLLRQCKELDVIYMTRIQKERFADPMEYEKFKGVYQIGKELLSHCKKDVKVMHPLPRVDEIKRDLDDTENAVYFKQAGYGVPVRQALLALVLGKVK